MKKLTLIIGTLVCLILIYTCKKENRPPAIVDIQVSPTEIITNSVVFFTALATDPEGDNLEYTWNCSTGTFKSTTGQSVEWTAPSSSGNVSINLTVSDGTNSIKESKSITILASIGSLSVISTPSGANIFMDGVDTKKITPGNFTDLATGKKIISVTKTGYLPNKDTISVNIQYKKTTTANFTLIPVANISGHVYYAGTKIPVSGVTISINNKAITTITTGSYSIPEIASGNAVLTATKPDYDPFSKSLTLNAGDNSLNIEMTSGIYTNTINGTAKTSIGTIIPAVIVYLLNEDGSSTNIHDQTDANGNYQLPAVPQGQRKLLFQKTGFNDNQKDIFVSNANRIFNAVLISKLITPIDPVIGISTIQYDQIKWSSNYGPELLSFNLYRSKEQSANYIKINTSPITIFTNPPANGQMSYNYPVDNLFTPTYYKISVINVDSYEGPLSNFILVNPNLTKPLLTTTPVILLSPTSATVGGLVSNEGGASVTERGIYWSAMPNPETNGTKILIGSGIGAFSKQLNGLIIGGTYYVKAYGINSVGTGFGQEVSFATIAALPSLTTLNISNVTATTAICSGNISSDGGAPVISRGLCWSLTPSPTINNDKTINGAGLGQFISGITGLSPNNTYYLRAYATNSSGTAYGNEKFFRTFTGTISDIDGNNYYTVTIGSQLWLAENLKTTKLNDGTNIQLVTDPSVWVSYFEYPAYCWYNNDMATNKPVYGALYDFNAAMSGKLCPTGWHVPSIYEVYTLIDYLGGSAIAGNKLKEPGTTHWLNGYEIATNESGFTAIGGGRRLRVTSGSAYSGLSWEGIWWTTTNHPPSSFQVYYLRLNSMYGNVETDNYSDSNAGYSVRCIKN